SRSVWGVPTSSAIDQTQGRQRTRRAQTLCAFGEDPFDLGVRARDDVYRDELAHASRRGRAGVDGRLDRTDVAAAHHGDVSRADVFLADEDDVGRLDHRVDGLDRTDEAFRFD